MRSIRLTSQFDCDKSFIAFPNQPVRPGRRRAFSFEKTRTGQLFSFQKRGTLRGTVSAQICRSFPVSFTYELLRTDLKNQQLSFTDFLASKAAGLPTET